MLIFSGSILLMLGAAVVLGARFLGDSDSGVPHAAAPVEETNAEPPQVEPVDVLENSVVQAPLEDGLDLMAAASDAILPGSDVELEIRVVDGQTTSVEVEPIGTLIPDQGSQDVGSDSFADFLELEAEALLARQSTDEDLAPHTAAVLADIEMQLNPLDPLDYEVPVEINQRTNLRAPEKLDEEDDVTVGVIFSKPEGGDLRLKSKPLNLDGLNIPSPPKPSLPAMRAKPLDPDAIGDSDSFAPPASARDSAANKPFSGLFKGLSKKSREGKD